MVLLLGELGKSHGFSLGLLYIELDADTVSFKASDC